MKKRNKFLMAILIGVLLVSIVISGGLLTVAGDNSDINTSNSIVPEIVVDTYGFELNNAPDAVINKEYKLFSATATDVYGKAVYVATNLYLHYDSVTKSLITINDSSFIPERYGEYTVEFSAVDERGNKAVLVYDFSCKEKENLSATFSGEYSKEALTGETYNIADIKYSNNVGAVVTDVYAVFDEDGSKIEINDGKFIPMYAGSYTITYEFSDYNESDKISYKLEVSATDVPVIMNDVTLQEYFIVGVKYQLPKLLCYDFKDGVPVKIDPVITVSVDGKEQNYDEQIGFIAEKEGNVVINYEISNGVNTIKKIYNSKIVDVGFVDYKMDMGKYFDFSDGITYQTTSDSLVCSFNESGVGGKFINSVMARELQFEFAIGDKNDYGSVEFILTDAVDKTQKLTYLFKNTGGVLYFSVNGGKLVKTAASFGSSRTTFYYDNETFAARIGESASVYPSGFEGFTSGNVYVEFKFNDVRAASEFVVYKINNQIINNSVADGMSPYVTFKPFRGGKQVVGNVVTLERIYVGDVLDPNFTVNYVVRDPERKVVTSIDGVELSGADYTREYSIALEKVGSYSILVEVSDSSGNAEQYSSSVTVGDNVAPKIVLTTGVETAKVGEKIKLKDAVAIDNIDENLKVFTFVASPSYEYLKIDADRNGDRYFTATSAGKYTIWYYAYDVMKVDIQGNVIAGNVGMTCYVITVTK